MNTEGTCERGKSDGIFLGDVAWLLTELEQLGEEFQNPVTKLRRQILIGSGHHDLHQFSTTGQERKMMY